MSRFLSPPSLPPSLFPPPSLLLSPSPSLHRARVGMTVADDADTYVRLRQVDGPPPRGTRMLAPSLTRPWHLRNDNTAVKAGSRRGAARGRQAQGVTDGMQTRTQTHKQTQRLNMPTRRTHTHTSTRSGMSASSQIRAVPSLFAVVSLELPHSLSH